MTAVDWSVYRACPVCKAKLGTACTTQTGNLLGATVERDRPHNRRQLRKGLR